MVYLSVLTLGEIEQGIVRAPDVRRAERLRRWVDDDLTPQFQGRILAIDASVMATWGQITGRAVLQGQPVSDVDSLWAATALNHGLTLVARSVKDIEVLPETILNPWELT